MLILPCSVLPYSFSNLRSERFCFFITFIVLDVCFISSKAPLEGTELFFKIESPHEHHFVFSTHLPANFILLLLLSAILTVRLLLMKPQIEIIPIFIVTVPAFFAGIVRVAHFCRSSFKFDVDDDDGIIVNIMTNLSVVVACFYISSAHCRSIERRP